MPTCRYLNEDLHFGTSLGEVEDMFSPQCVDAEWQVVSVSRCMWLVVIATFEWLVFITHQFLLILCIYTLYYIILYINTLYYTVVIKGAIFIKSHSMFN